MSLSYENETSRIKKLEEIIDACYQNIDEISYCLQNLDLRLTESSKSATLLQKNKELVNCGSCFTREKIKTKCLKGTPIFENNEIYWTQAKTLGDCWLLAAFNIFVINASYKKKIFRVKNNGSVDLHIFFNGAKITPPNVTPIFEVGFDGELKYASSRGAIFAPLFEKALATLHGGYANLDGGFEDEGKINFFLFEFSM